MSDGPSNPRGSELAGHTRTVGLITLGSRFGGMVRDVIIARLFGDTALGAAFWAAFAIPNMFRRLFGEGALSAAFIPEYTGAVRDDPRIAPRLAVFTLVLLGAVTGVLTALGELGLLVALFRVSPASDAAVFIRLTMIMLPFMPAICMAAILGAMLQVHGRFAPAASGPIVLNAFMVAVGVWALATGRAGDEAIAATLGVATVLSAITQSAWFAFLLRSDGPWGLAMAGIRDRALRMAKRFVPVMLGLGALQLSTFIDVAIAMWPTWVGGPILGIPHTLDASSNAVLAASQRLYQFPLGVFGIAVATAAFPSLSRTAGRAEFDATLRAGVRLSMYIALPAGLGLFLVRHDAVRALFQGEGSGFSDAGLARAAAVLVGYSVGIWAFSLNQLLTRALYAIGDTTTPMRITLAMLVVNVAISLSLVNRLAEAGLAWSTSLCATVQCVALALSLGRKGVGIVDRPTLVSIGRTAVVTLLMGAGVLGVQAAIPAAGPGLSGAARLVVGGVVGLVIFAGTSWITRAPEFRDLLRRGK